MTLNESATAPVHGERQAALEWLAFEVGITVFRQGKAALPQITAQSNESKLTILRAIQTTFVNWMK